MLIDNISLIIFMPFWIFLIIMCGRFFSVYVNKFIVYILTLFSSGLGMFVCFWGLRGFSNTLEWTHPFIRINDFVIPAGLYVDKLSLIFGLMLFTISFAVQLFSVSYMKNEKKNYRFYALLNLFNFGMSALLFSPNLYQLYVFWELIGVVSYLLIGFEYTKPIKSQASKRVFLVNRFGDTALIGGLILTTYFMYTSAGNLSYAALSIMDLNSISTILMGYTSTFEFMAICGLFIIGCMVKSAQFPFHVWLQDAMEAKTPVSSLLHSATLVAAGIYLIIRLMPFLTLHKSLLEILIIIGVVTALVCAVMASVETHPKKVLAYSTSANLGLVMISLGLLNIKLALVFLIMHALVKSKLFISLPNEDNTYSNLKFFIFILGSLSLSGLIFAGISAKDMFYGTVLGHSILYKVFLVIIFLTAFYLSRLCLILKKTSDFKRSFSIIEMAAFMFLLACNIGFSVFLVKVKFSLTIPYITAVCGVITALILFKINVLTYINKLPSISAQILYRFVPVCYEKLASLSLLIENKVFSNYKLILSFCRFCVRAVNYTEQKIMNGSVKMVANSVEAISRNDMILQSKNVQTYNAYAFIILTAAAVVVVIGYMFIIAHLGV